jgi:phosphotransferase system IIB component
MFCPIAGYPNYIISNEGVIYSQDGEMKQRITQYGYKQIGLRNKGQKYFQVHRLVYQHFGKDWNPDLTIDHIDCNKENNHISNLRMATQQQQIFNQKVRKSKLGVKGVYKSGNKYRARIRINDKLINLGTFDTEEEAGEVFKIKAREIQGEFFRE